jgi:hypothetical protein
MLDKFELFDMLLSDIQNETAQCLATPDLVYLDMTSKKHLAFFKPLVDVRKLLHYVVLGGYGAVKKMLKKDNDLIFKRGQVMDSSGRIFENISGFEYALWALDYHMWTTMFSCLPQNNEGIKILAKLLSQYHKVRTEGVTYWLHNKKFTEKHFDFENTIIKELQIQVNSINASGDKDRDAIDRQWREGVGGAQKLFPTHIVYEYCSKQSFYPEPKFNKQPEVLSKQFCDKTGKKENWFSVDSKLSIDFAIYKAGRSEARAEPVAWQRAQRAVFDLAAMRALCEIRTKEFINIESQLGWQMTIDNQPRAS